MSDNGVPKDDDHYENPDDDLNDEVREISFLFPQRIHTGRNGVGLLINAGERPRSSSTTIFLVTNSQIYLGGNLGNET